MKSRGCSEDESSIAAFTLYLPWKKKKVSSRLNDTFNTHIVHSPIPRASTPPRRADPASLASPPIASGACRRAPSPGSPCHRQYIQPIARIVSTVEYSAMYVERDVRVLKPRKGRPVERDDELHERSAVARGLEHLLRPEGEGGGVCAIHIRVIIQAYEDPGLCEFGGGARTGCYVEGRVEQEQARVEPRRRARGVLQRECDAPRT